MTDVETDAVSMAVEKALYAYGMAYKCQREVDRMDREGYDGGYCAYYLEWSAKQWTDEARQWRRIAERLP